MLHFDITQRAQTQGLYCCTVRPHLCTGAPLEDTCHWVFSSLLMGIELPQLAVLLAIPINNYMSSDQPFYLLIYTQGNPHACIPRNMCKRIH